MNEQINVLIVEDEPLTIDGLKNVLEYISNTDGILEFNIRTALNCDAAYFEIEKAVRGTPFDLVLLDINIPPSEERKLLSGEDIGIKLRVLLPKVKIIVSTSHNENYRLNNILKSIKPEGLIMKNEITASGMKEAIEKVLNNSPYYTSTALRLVRRHATNDFALDKRDRQLLYYLSRGVKSKDLSSYLELSKSGVNLRKRKIREVFNIDDNNDITLLDAAKENGYL
jgi:DNA-binding NarL/FixJ family response regulator